MSSSAKNKKVPILRAWLGWGSSIARYQIETTPLSAKKSSAKKIFGSNLFLNNRLLVSTPTKPYASLREAGKIFSENDPCLIAEYLYPVVKTYFIRNSG